MLYRKQPLPCCFMMAARSWAEGEASPFFLFLTSAMKSKIKGEWSNNNIQRQWVCNHHQWVCNHGLWQSCEINIPRILPFQMQDPFMHTEYRLLWSIKLFCYEVTTKLSEAAMTTRDSNDWACNHVLLQFGKNKHNQKIAFCYCFCWKSKCIFHVSVLYYCVTIFL